MMNSSGYLEEEKVDSCSEKSELGNPLYCSYVDGVYTYKDPGTDNEFRWDDVTKQWKPKKSKLMNPTSQGRISMSTEEQRNDNWNPATSPPPQTKEEETRVSGITSPFRGSRGDNGGEGFRNPNYDSTSHQQHSTASQPRRFYYAALSPSEMGVNEPLLFLSPDDQVNNNSTVSPPDDDIQTADSQHRRPRVGGAVEPLLPSGWERHEDSSGPYYWHIKSGTIQRDQPSTEQRLDASANPALLIPGSLSTCLNPSAFRRSQTISSQMSSSTSFSAANNGFTAAVTKNHSLDMGRGEADFLRREKGQGDVDRAEKRRSWSQFLPEDEGRVEEKSIRFGGVSLGSLSISEENLTPERSSRAVSKVIAELTTQGTGKGITPSGMEVAGRIWGGGSELYLELDDAHLRLRTKDRDLIVGEQAIHSIRVWGVGRDDPRDFAYVAREKITRQFLCHVFRLEMSARPLASALRDACKKIMIERQQKQKRPTTLPTTVRTRGTPSNSTVAFFPTPMDEPRKVIKAYYLGTTTVSRPTGMETLNSAIDTLRDNYPLPVNISVAPSVLLISSDETQNPKVEVEIRVRYLSFMGIGRDIETCGVIVHTARDDFQAHAFYSTPSSAALAKAIEAACVLRYQKCLDAHHSHVDGPEVQSPSSSEQTTSSGSTPSTKTGANLAVAFKNVLASFTRAKSVEEKT